MNLFLSPVSTIYKGQKNKAMYDPEESEFDLDVI